MNRFFFTLLITFVSLGVKAQTTSFGLNSLNSNTTGVGNSGFGYLSLYFNTTGNQNDAFGEASLLNNTLGNANSAFGNISLRSNTSGMSNAAFGLASLSSNTTGNGNSAFGVNSMMDKGVGEFNSSFGFDSFRHLQSGSHNVGIGYNVGATQQSGNRNIAIGSEVSLVNPTGSNQLNIGNWIYGKNGYIGIGTTSPTARLEINSEQPNISGLKFTQFNANTPLTREATAIGVDASGNVVAIESSGGTAPSNAWDLTGNSGTDDAVNFIGTTDTQDLVFKTKNEERMRLTQTGRLQFHNQQTAQGWSHNLLVGGGNDTMSGLVNTVFGIGALIYNTTGEVNTAIGSNALRNNTVGVSNTAIGSNAMMGHIGADIQYGEGNIAIGPNALLASEQGHYNISIGGSNSSQGEIGYANVSIGSLATRNLDGESNENVALGHRSALGIQNMNNSVVIGTNTLNNSPTTEAYFNNIVIGDRINLDTNFQNQLNIGNWIRGNNGIIGIGTDNLPDFADASSATENNYRLFVKDGIRTEKLRVDIASINGWADYVFEKEYKLLSLDALETYIKQHKHLPNIPSAEEVTRNGLELTEYSAKLLEKVEELTLYSIQLNKENKALKAKTKSQEVILQSLLKRVEDLEKKTSK